MTKLIIIWPVFIKRLCELLMIDNPIPNPHPASPLSGGGVTALKVQILAHYLGVIVTKGLLLFNDEIIPSQLTCGF